MAYIGLYLRNLFGDLLRFNPAAKAAMARALRLKAWFERNPTRRLALLARAARLCPHWRGLQRALRIELEQLDPGRIDWAWSAAPRQGRIAQGADPQAAGVAA